MLSTLLVVGVISHLWCAARLVGIAHHSFYSVGRILVTTPYLSYIGGQDRWAGKMVTAMAL